MNKIQFELDIRLHSEANSTDHWTVKRKRRLRQQWVLKSHWLNQNYNVSLPCKIRLVRLCRHFFDDDNNVIAFKAIRDCISDLIIPGLAPGRADGDKRITWEYDQEKKSKNGVRIEITHTLILQPQK